MPASETAASVADLFLEFGLLLLGLGLLARLAHALSISPVPLYLLAGLFFGDGGLVGIRASDSFVSTSAELGVVLLLLLLGLEYSATELVRTARQQSLRLALALLFFSSLSELHPARYFGWA